MWLVVAAQQQPRVLRTRLALACAALSALFFLEFALKHRLFVKLKRAREVRGPPDRLVICTTVSNELSYMPEWIEFYALQGASRIVIGDHLSRDSLFALPSVYAGRPGYPAVEVLPDPGGQAPFLQACARKHSRSSWLLFVDNDEFVWSPRYGSLFAYLDTMPKEVTQVNVFGTRFGMGRCKRPAVLRVAGNGLKMTRPEVPPHPAAVGNGSSLPWPLVIESHTRRMPCSLYDPAEERIIAALRDSGDVTACNQTLMRSLYGASFSGADFCSSDIVTFKSFVRGDAFNFFTSGNPHYAQLKRGITHRELNTTLLRFNHYWVRCRSTAYAKARQWSKHDPVEWAEQSGPIGTAVLDEGLLPLVEPIKQRLARLLV